MQHETIEIFPTTVCKSKVDTNLINEIIKWQNESTDFVYQEVFNNPIFAELQNAVETEAQRICPKTERIDQWKIVSAWANNQPPQQKGFGFHGHADSFISAVLYLQGEEMSLSFRDSPRESPTTNTAQTKFDIIVRHTWHDDVSIPVEIGDLLFFPSYLLHEPNHNLSNKERVSIAYNLVPTRKNPPSSPPWSMAFNL